MRLQDYQIDNDPFWLIGQMRGETGYEIVEPAQHHRWVLLASWGEDGWDLGSWPYVMVFVRNTPTLFELAYYVEGDVETHSFKTRELRTEAIDELAFYHWKHENEPWVEGIDKIEDAPARLRGGYGSVRERAS